MQIEDIKSQIEKIDFIVKELTRLRPNCEKCGVNQFEYKINPIINNIGYRLLCKECAKDYPWIAEFMGSIERLYNKENEDGN